MTMNIELLKRVIEGSDVSAADEFWDDQATRFWVDWREEDDNIPRYCEELIKTGSLSGIVYNIEEEPGFAVDILYKGVATRVPLIEGPEDRHITLVTLNKVLNPDYELRYYIPSHGSDGAAIVPLPMRVWEELEAEFGPKVAKQFYRIADKPNIFTDRYSFDEDGSLLSYESDDDDGEEEDYDEEDELAPPAPRSPFVPYNSSAPRPVTPFLNSYNTATPSSQPGTFDYASPNSAPVIADRGQVRTLTLFELLFSFHGRISRGAWWFTNLFQLGMCVVYVALATVLHSMFGRAWDAASFPAMAGLIILLCYIQTAAAAKRFHDIDASGWSVTMLPIPIIGALIWFIGLGCLPGKNVGTNGSNNHYGPDPLQTLPGPAFVRTARWDA